MPGQAEPQSGRSLDRELDPSGWTMSPVLVGRLHWILVIVMAGAIMIAVTTKMQGLSVRVSYSPHY